MKQEELIASQTELRCNWNLSPKGTPYVTRGACKRKVGNAQTKSGDQLSQMKRVTWHVRDFSDQGFFGHIHTIRDLMEYFQQRRINGVA